MTQYTDEECIAIAILHGAQFYNGRGVTSKFWYIGPDTVLHPIEKERLKHNDTSGFPSLAAIARAYCNYYNLLR